MKKTLLYLSFTAVLILNVAAIQYSSNPPTGYTNAPGQSNCTSCHLGAKGPILNPVTGSLSIIFNNGVNSYKSGLTYSVTVTLKEPGISTWGFEMTVFPGIAGTTSTTSIGTLSTSDPNLIITSVGTTAKKQYISHNVAGQGKGTQSWTFNWVAPANASGPISFYAAGNAADGNGAEIIDPSAPTAGDHIYTKNLTISQIVTGLESNSELKAEPYLYSFDNKIFANNLEKTYDAVEVDLIDVKGNLVKKISTNSSDLNEGIEVTDLHSGVFITKFTKKDKVIKGKIVIQ